MIEVTQCGLSLIIFLLEKKCSKNAVHSVKAKVALDSVKQTTKTYSRLL